MRHNTTNAEWGGGEPSVLVFDVNETLADIESMDHFVERQFSVEATRAYKPAPQTYHLVAQNSDAPLSSCFMIAAHVWDTVEARSVGYSARLITRPGNAPVPVASLRQPDILAPDLPDMAAQLIQRRRASSGVL